MRANVTSAVRTACILGLLCAALAWAPEQAADALSLDRQAVLRGELWRLWTGHLVHFSAGHAATDITLLVIVAAIAHHEAGHRTTQLALWLGAPLIALGLLTLVPDLLVYKGSSGLATLLGVLAGMRLGLRAPPLRAALGCIVLVAIAKTWLDAHSYLAALSSVPAGIRVAWQAHVIAGLSGVALVMATRP